MPNTGVTGITLARQVWMKSRLSVKTSFAMRVLARQHGSDWDLLGKAGLGEVSLVLCAIRFQHADAQTTLLQDILRDEGLGRVKRGSGWDLLGKAGLDELFRIHLPTRHPS